MGCFAVTTVAVDSPPPPPPDYASPAAWAAWPARASAADEVPPAVTEVPASDRTADVFFIHPTTYLATSMGNARYDEPGATRTRLEQGVLRFQASAFNACCRIYAPRYRQASLGAFLKAKDAALATPAYEMAYGDVQRAFDYYIAHENQGRPFVLASHSQGSLHALRLLQERIAGHSLQRQLIAAYIIGYYVPIEIARTGVPLCDGPQTTGCLLDWNTVAAGTDVGARRASRLIWLEGRYQPLGNRRVACVNPLNWRPDGEAAASLNLGALPAVPPGQALRAPVPQLTGARCDGALLRVSIPWRERTGFANLLSFFGSYHVFDYNLFYLNIRANALERVAAYCTTSTPVAW
jgi:Protein of unknown function (DUF3089)